MNRLLMLPITIPLRIAALQLRLARAAAEAALDLTRDLAGGSPPDRDDAVATEAPPVPATPAAPRAAEPDPAVVAAVRLYEGQNESRPAILLATET